jgi:hypothetical protein
MSDMTNTPNQTPVQPPTREQIAEGLALIAEADGALSVVGDGDWTWQDTMLRRIADHYRAVLALFPQPGPSAVHEDMSEYAQNERRHRQAILDGWAAEPVSIADMALGTTFRAEGVNVPDTEHRFHVMERGGRQWLTCLTHGTGARPDYVDPSTIRDVAPPPATPEEGER